MGLNCHTDTVPIFRRESGVKDDIYVTSGQIIELGEIKEFLAICGGI
jgi:hypothetical protein